MTPSFTDYSSLIIGDYREVGESRKLRGRLFYVNDLQNRHNGMILDHYLEDGDLEDSKEGNFILMITQNRQHGMIQDQKYDLKHKSRFKFNYIIQDDVIFCYVLVSSSFIFSFVHCFFLFISVSVSCLSFVFSLVFVNIYFDLNRDCNRLVLFNLYLQ